MNMLPSYLPASQHLARFKMSFDCDNSREIVLVVLQERSQSLLVAGLEAMPKANRLKAIHSDRGAAESDLTFNNLLSAGQPAALAHPPKIEGFKILSEIDSQVRTDTRKVKGVPVIRHKTSAGREFGEEAGCCYLRSYELDETRQR
jgi:hypothetical protein